MGKVPRASGRQSDGYAAALAWLCCIRKPGRGVAGPFQRPKGRRDGPPQTLVRGGEWRAQYTIVLASQQNSRNTAVVDLGAEQDELALHHVLGLEPVLGEAAAIEALEPLGDDAFEPELGGAGDESDICRLCSCAV